MPLFWNISPFMASPYLQMSEAYYAGKNWPYSYAFTSGRQTYFGIFDSGTPYWEAVAKNNMMNNPFYIPYIPLNVGPETGVSDSDIAATHNMANKDILSAEYSALGSNLATLLSNIDRALTSADLTPSQKAALESKKEEVKELLERQKAFARKSANMDVMDARREVNSMYKEYNDLNASVGDIMQSIQAGEDVDPDMTPEQIKQEYESTTKPAIDELLNNPGVTKEEKDAIQAKQKELEDAIAQGKSQAELNKLKNELQDLIDGVNARLHPDDEEEPVVDHDTPETLSAAQIKAKLPEIKDDVDAIRDDDNVSSSTKSKIEGKLRELKNAIRQNKSEEEIQKLYKELKYMITNAEYESEINQLDADTHIGADDKNAIKDKYKEIKKAIQDGKSPEEIQALYDELDDMIADAKDDVSRANDRDEGLKTKAQERFDSVIADFEKWKQDNKEVYPYIKHGEIKKIEGLIAKYNEAVEKGAPSSELNKIIGYLENAIKQSKANAVVQKDNGKRIGDKIFYFAKNIKYLVGLDKNRTTNEAYRAALYKQIEVVSKKGVIAVMRHWYEAIYANTNVSGQRDDGLLHTIDKAFKDKDPRKNKAVEHILKAIEDYAKENGLENEVGNYIGTIRTLFVSGDKDGAYHHFNKMLKEVFGIPVYMNIVA